MQCVTLFHVHLPHPLGIAGVVVNMAGVLFLLFYPPKIIEYTEDGRQKVEWVNDVKSATGQRRHRLRRDGYRLGIALLFLGFFLQLLDLLTS
jgi:hypothetical protein